MRSTTILALIVMTATSAVRAADPFNYGRYWLSLSVEAHSAYVDGVVDGINHAFKQAAAEWLESGERFRESERVERARKKIFPMFGRDTLLPVMFDLYKNPANAFVDPVTVLYLSRDKLLGESIDRALVDARKRAIENHELNKNIKQK